MIFSTLNQFNCFLFFIFFGIVSGLIGSALNILFLKKYQKIYLKIIFDTIFYTFFAIFYVIFINLFNFGKFSFALIASCILGFVWINKLLFNLVDFLQIKWYNIFIKIFKHKGKTNARKRKFKKS